MSIGLSQVYREYITPMQVAEKRRKPSPTLMLTEVYAEMPVRLRKQHEQMRAHVANYAEHYSNTFAPIDDLPTVASQTPSDNSPIADTSATRRK